MTMIGVSSPLKPSRCSASIAKPLFSAREKNAGQGRGQSLGATECSVGEAVAVISRLILGTKDGHHGGHYPRSTHSLLFDW